MIQALALAAFVAAPAEAQQPPPVDALRACVEAAEREPEDERACVGAQALACIDADPSAGTPAGMAACYAAETAAWDGVMSATIIDLVALAAALGTPDADADQAGLLDAAQRAWAAFRDADCAQAAGQWGDDATREVAAAQCALDRTAARALELVAKRRAFENP